MAAVPPTLDIENLPPSLLEPSVGGESLAPDPEEGGGPFSGVAAAVPLGTAAVLDAPVAAVASTAAGVEPSAMIQSAFDNLDDSIWDDALSQPPPPEQPQQLRTVRQTQSTAGAAFTHQGDDDDDQLGAFTIDDVFGSLVQHDELEKAVAQQQQIVDPKCFDVHDNVNANFDQLRSDEIEEMLDNAGKAEEVLKLLAAKEVRISSENESFAEAEKVGFGPKAALLQDFPADDGTRPAALLRFVYATIPKLPQLPASENLWLVDLPKVEPNRQILHVEAEPLTTSTTPRHSDDRRLFTPHNVMRWTYNRTTKEALSNARLVTWSDGSVSVQVGKDAFDVLPQQEASFSLLTTDIVLTASLPFRNGNQAQLAAVHPTAHFTLKVQSAKNTIDHTLVHEGRLQRAPLVSDRLAIPQKALPEFADKKNKEKRSLVEEHIDVARELRRKAMQRTPMNMTDQILQETELLTNAVNAPNAELEEMDGYSRGHVEEEMVQQPSRLRRRQVSQPASDTSLAEDTLELEKYFHEEALRMAAPSAAAAAAPTEAATAPARKVRRIEPAAAATSTFSDRVRVKLTEYLAKIPATSTNAVGIVNGMLSFVHDLSNEALLREVPKMLTELRTECPEVVGIPCQELLDAVGFEGGL